MRAGSFALAIAVLAVTSFGGVASAQAQDRTLTFKQMHTGETATITYRRGGRYDAAGLKQINYMLRDWRRNEPIDIDPRLLDVLWEVYRASGSRAAVHVLSGYRSPVTNAALRARSSGVADNSQHTLGKALDFYLPDVPTAKLREVALRVQGGGVGFYPKSGSPFVHIDTGSVRHWPRMTRQQLANLFPDGKTIHIPSDGKPLAGYEVAKAEIARGRSAPAVTASTSRNLLAGLFNFGGNNRPTEQPAAAAASAVASAPAPAQQPQPSVAVATTPEPTLIMAAAPIPTPRPAAASAMAPVKMPVEVPIPAEAPILTASLPTEALPRERPMQAAPAALATALRPSPGALEALIALAPSSGIEDERLPFSATFTEDADVVDSEPSLVALDLSSQALRPFMTPETCLSGAALAEMRHPDQRDLASLMMNTSALIADHFAPRRAVHSVGGFSGPAVAPLPSRLYRSASLTRRDGIFIR